MSLSPTTYRELEWNDTPAALALATHVFGVSAVSDISRWLASANHNRAHGGLPSLVVGAFVDAVLVGFAGAMENPACEHVVSLGNLAVLPQHRGRGIGRQLVILRAEWAQRERPSSDVDRILELSCYEALEPYHASHGFGVALRHRPGISCIMQATAPVVLAACLAHGH